MSDSEYKQRGAVSAQTDPDVQLMLRISEGEGDALAFQELVFLYQPRLLRVLRHIVGSESVAEDLVQDVFLRVWRARKRYQPTAKFATWLFHIANNVASNSLRDRNRRREFQIQSGDPLSSAVVSLEQMATASTGSMPTRRLDKVEREEIVRLALESLNERQRLALLLSRFEHMSYEEIANSMNLSQQAVKSLLSRARVNLKTILAPYIENGLLPTSEPSEKDDHE